MPIERARTRCTAVVGWLLSIQVYWFICGGREERARARESAGEVRARPAGEKARRTGTAQFLMSVMLLGGLIAHTYFE